MARKSRRLGEEEEALWSAVARTTIPLRGKPALSAGEPAEAPPVTPRPLRVPERTDAMPMVRPILPAAPRTEWIVAADPVRELGPSTPGLDRRTAEKLRRGRTPPEARIDLHGHTLERAHGVLAGFIAGSHARGMRCVLVITGKGRPREEHFHHSRNGILKDSVPRWLSLPPLGPLVVGVYPAHRKHGGGGAFYVYLRRNR
ncbi:DNA mismatch repair protein MutS [Paroceanicella profunda]|uniref:DNA mismatch repair protein MutS n=1 Tax=Paroceanicella profunda TaxID=2579971 RepID=A0A5B8FRD8_9RHOB|nr:Smr/MutS family protein [Paroceanicella profunda]QDL91296.1 DNA mismatch repair protein MutS [Paroceanicella profunda]